jgi:hypothetical protein
MRGVALFGAVVGMLLVVLDAGAGGAPSAPRIDEASEASKASRLSSDCSQPQAVGGKWHTHCTFIETSVSPPPSSVEIDRDLAELDADIAKRGAAVLTEPCKGIAQATADHRLPAPGTLEEPFAKAMQQVCTSKSVSQYRQAIAESMHQVAAHTCKVSTGTWAVDFDQLDANTWIGNPGPVGTCNVSRVTTLWSDPKLPFLWNYKEVETVAPSTDPGCVRMGAGNTVITEFLWTNVRTRDLGCRFLKM